MNKITTAINEEFPGSKSGVNDISTGRTDTYIKTPLGYMRYATTEESKAIDDYINSISKPTGVTIDLDDTNGYSLVAVKSDISLTEEYKGDGINRQYVIDKLSKLSEFKHDDTIYISKANTLQIVHEALPYKEENKNIAHWVHISIDAGCDKRICDHCGGKEPYKFAEDEAEVYHFCPHCGFKIEKLKRY